MQITTKHFHLSEMKIIKINFVLLWRRYWWLWIVLIVIVQRYVGLLLTLAGAASVIVILFLLVLLKIRERKTVLSQEILAQIDDNFLTMSLSDGTLGRVHFQHFKRAFFVERHYVLFLSSVAAYFLPADAFQTREDRIAFSCLLKEKKLLKK